MKMPKPVFIYGLRDPRDGQYHYIGKTINPKARMAQHLKDTETNRARVDWLADCAAAGVEPEMVTLDRADAKTWDFTERLWIAKGREQGWPLTNISDGGEEGGGEPDFSWFTPYLRPDLRERFNALSVTRRMEICHLAALAMCTHLEGLLEEKRDGAPVNWPYENAHMHALGCRATTAAIVGSD